MYKKIYTGMLVSMSALFFVPQIPAMANPYVLSALEDEDPDKGEISGTFYNYNGNTDYYFLDKDENQLGAVPLEFNSETNEARIPMNTKLPEDAIRIGAFGVHWDGEYKALEYIPVFDGEWHSFVNDATFYDTDLDKDEYGGHIEWGGPAYKGNLYDYIISATISEGNYRSHDEVISVVPVHDGTDYRYELPQNTNLKNIMDADIWGRNIVGDHTPGGIVLSMPDRYEIENLSSHVDLSDRLDIHIYDADPIEGQHFVWLSAFSEEGMQDNGNRSLIAILDQQQNVVEFVGELSDINFLYKFPKNFDFPANAKYLGVFWKSGSGEIIGKAIEALPDELVGAEETSEKLRSNQVSVLPAGKGQFFVQLNDLPTKSEIKIYDKENALYTKIPNSTSYSTLITLPEETDNLFISIKEETKLESEKLNISLKNTKWDYFGEAKNVDVNKVWKVKFNKSANPDDLTDKNIYLLNKSGEAVPIIITPAENNTEVNIQAKKPFENGSRYYLYVNEDIRDLENNKTLSSGYVKVFETKK